jgi:hypothetical protein
MRANANSRIAIGKPLRPLALALSMSALIPGPAAADGPAPAAGVAPPRALHHHRLPVREDRATTLSKALDLDGRQQSELRKVLEDEREQINRVWSDSTVPTAYRVSVTREINDRTADRIRALLRDEQKKKYTPPRQPHETVPGAGQPSVEDWMNAVKRKQPPS